MKPEKPKAEPERPQVRILAWGFIFFFDSLNPYKQGDLTRNMGKTSEEKWKELKKHLSKCSGKNAILLRDLANDFELGTNVGKKKGFRAPNSLLRLYRTNKTILKLLGNKPFSKKLKKPTLELFKKMASGEIRKSDGERYKDVSEFVKNWKVLCAWAFRTGRIDEDIASELSVAQHKGVKPAWVYLGEKMKMLIDSVRGDYRAYILFLYDSGLRPQEAWKIKVSDFSDDFQMLNIPEKRENGERVSKTFERTIKLKQSSDLIKQFVESNHLKDTDYLIRVKQPAFNQYLKASVLNLFGNPRLVKIQTIKGEREKKEYDDITTKARGKLSQIKAYDIRHNSACYWLDRYKTNKDLMYRFGWLREDKVFYYSEFFGKRDKIDDEDMMTKEDKTQLELEVGRLKKELIEMKDSNENLVNTLLTRFNEETTAVLEKYKNGLPTPTITYSEIKARIKSMEKAK